MVGNQDGRGEKLGEGRSDWDEGPSVGGCVAQSFFSAGCGLSGMRENLSRERGPWTSDQEQRSRRRQVARRLESVGASLLLNVRSTFVVMILAGAGENFPVQSAGQLGTAGRDVKFWRRSFGEWRENCKGRRIRTMEITPC